MQSSVFVMRYAHQAGSVPGVRLPERPPHAVAAAAGSRRLPVEYSPLSSRPAIMSWSASGAERHLPDAPGRGHLRARRAPSAVASTLPPPGARVHLARSPSCFSVRVGAPSRQWRPHCRPMDRLREPRPAAAQDGKRREGPSFPAGTLRGSAPARARAARTRITIDCPLCGLRATRPAGIPCPMKHRRVGTDAYGQRPARG